MTVVGLHDTGPKSLETRESYNIAFEYAYPHVFVFFSTHIEKYFKHVHLHTFPGMSNSILCTGKFPKSCQKTSRALPPPPPPPPLPLSPQARNTDRQPHLQLPSQCGSTYNCLSRSVHKIRLPCCYDFQPPTATTTTATTASTFTSISTSTTYNTISTTTAAVTEPFVDLLQLLVLQLLLNLSLIYYSCWYCSCC